MKEITNLSKRILMFDLDSYEDNGRRKTISINPGESVKIEDEEIGSKQLQTAIFKNAVGVVDLKSKKKREVKKEEPKNLVEEKDKTTDKEDK